MSFGLMRQKAIDEILKGVQDEKDDLEDRVLKVISVSTTKQKNITDFPAIYSHLTTMFPQVDVSDVPIYVASASSMNKNGFTACGGCYIRHMRVILVKKKIMMGAASNKKDKLGQCIQANIATSVNPEDVVIHELFHAISHKTNRPGNEYEFAEEEFVYTNSAKFYEIQGTSLADIVDTHLLTFFINDIMSSRKALIEVWKRSGAELPSLKNISKKQFQHILDRDAEALAPVFIDVARERGHKMIDLYKKYGNKQIGSNKIDYRHDSRRRMKHIQSNCDI